jgi:hypothetical protein
MYDIVFIGSDTEFSKRAFRRFQNRFPLTKSVFNNDVQKAFALAKKKVFTRMYWVVWGDLNISPDFNFDYQVPEWDLDYVHSFLNYTGKYDGISLIPKNKHVGSKEIAYRFFLNNKKVDIIASIEPAYDIFYIDTYEDYLNAVDNSATTMTWLVPKEVIPLDDFKFDLIFDYNSGELELNHVFQNNDRGEIKFNGPMLVPTNTKLSRREIEYRFPIQRKEYDIVATRQRPYDVVFISYNEINADSNWNRLKSIVPRAKRIHGVKGIHQAHIAASKLVETPMFFVVDGDAVVENTFDFELLLPDYDEDIVHVWKSQNPINGLEYGYGGIKLLPTELTLNMDTSSTDMTMNISSKFKLVDKVSNVTAFNTDAFTTWRSAFRECCKLAMIDNEESLERLVVWCTLQDNAPYGFYAYSGALAGKQYGQKNAANLAALSLINDFTWLQDKFNQQQ